MKNFDLTTGEDGSLRTYGIRFVTADGRVSEIYDARKNVKNPHAEVTGDNNDRTKQKYHLKTHGAVKLFNDNSEEYRDVKLAHMIAFRPFNQKEWIPIVH